MVNYLVKHRTKGTKKWNTLGFHFINKKPSKKYLTSIGLNTRNKEIKYSVLKKR